jgi:uncharacterized protein (TIGR04255 family)
MEEKRKEFKNPPVIEAWIEFEINLTDESVLWNEDVAKELINKNFPEFKKIDFFGLAQVTLDPKTRGVSSTGFSFERVKAFTEAQDRCIQASRNTLVFNHIKKNIWPTFTERRDQAFGALDKYLAFRHLNKLRTVALHYRDIVQIPKGDNGMIKLEDYFTISPRVPEDRFGALSNFMFMLELPNINKSANTLLAVGSDPSQKSSDTHYRFIMDWHLTPRQEITDVANSRKWLNDAHDVNFDAFVSAFTEKGLALFDTKGDQ